MWIDIVQTIMLVVSFVFTVIVLNNLLSDAENLDKERRRNNEIGANLVISEDKRKILEIENKKLEEIVCCQKKKKQK